jgi:hypothetical protein
LQEHFTSGGELTDSQWRTLIQRTGAIRVRARWPVDQPFAMFVSPPPWLHFTQIRVQPRDASLAAMSGGTLSPGGCGTCHESTADRERYQEIGTLPLGRRRLEFDVVVEMDADFKLDWEARRAGHFTESTKTAWTGAMQFDVEIVPSLVDVMPERSDEALDAAVRERLRLTASKEGHLGSSCWAARDPLPSTAVSVQIDLCEAGEARGSAQLVVKEHGTIYSRMSQELRLPEGDVDRSRWTLRVRGTSEEALKRWDADHYWAGEIVVPVDELKPDRDWARFAGFEDQLDPETGE